MKKTAAEAAQTKQDLLLAALSVFSRKGYHATRLADISAEAGVTRGAIYHHFGNKAGLYRALIEMASSAGSGVVQAAIAQGGRFIDILERILVMSFELLEDNPQIRDIMALYLFNTELTDELQDVREKIREESIVTVQGIAAQMQMGIDMGELRPDIAPEVYARAFLGYQNGIIDLWLGNQTAFSIKDSAPALADAFLRGFVK